MSTPLIPPAQLDGVALGRQRLGVNVLSRIATLREEGRLPIRMHPVVSVHRPSAAPQPGAIVSAIHDRATGPTSGGRDPGPASAFPAQWSTATKPAGVKMATVTCGLSAPPPERYFLRRGRGKAVVDEALGESFSGVLVTISTLPTTITAGRKQRCWAHLLRDIHDLVALYPSRHLAGPVGRGSPSALSRPGLSPILRHNAAHRSTGLGAAAAGHLPALPG